ncbi:MAG TPA: transcription-repair coupling factor [Bacteroidales bacterium]|nr:transcription-repair coupling factor [Bacteroidales bacterium]
MHKIIALQELYSAHPNINECKKAIQSNQNVYLRNLQGSAKSFFINNIIQAHPQSQLIVLNDKESAAYLYNDLALLNSEKNIFFFPSSYKRSVLYGQDDKDNLLMRAETMQSLVNESKTIMISYPEAIIEKVIARDKIKQVILPLHISEKVSIDFIQDVLDEYNFQYVDFVYEPGQYSIRGSIIDIFSFASDHPFRIDFFGDEIESIRSFDIQSQLSIKQFEYIDIVPNIVNPEKQQSDFVLNQSIFDFIPSDSIIWFQDIPFTLDKISEVESKLEGEDLQQIITFDYTKNKLKEFKLVEFGLHNSLNSVEIKFNTSHQPVFNKNFELLANTILENTEKLYNTYILSDNEKQIERLQSVFNDIHPDIVFNPILNTIHEGFIEHDLKLCVYTDHQIFGRYHKFKIKSSLSKKEQLTIQELTNLHPGDYVVHIDHGIGKFGGLEKIEKNGKKQEAIKLVYRDRDTLYVSIHALHKISKYKGKDSEPPKIYKLGSGAWQKLKQNTKNKVKDIARELILLYAQRKNQEGFSFSPDSYLQRELESSFIYEDTPDQLTTTIAVKDDMESDTPMDRLVCGDVGFGKTEIAVRAAFKAVADNKQVAILVPTTILALQHYQTFKERLADFPCNVEYLSRLRSKKHQTEVIKNMAEGKVDIVIGTHKLVGKDIKFKDLGLLIIDEEQKFGVAVKENLKKLKINVDTLTLTATPIPRTLQFSMMGARDLSIINTPPPNRYPIITELHTFNEDIIKEAIEYEFQRNGQVFFIHNRVQNINEIETIINKLCPDVRTVVAHGQMQGNELEKVMLDFIHYEYDVLIATTIIESGLDIPNANTIIINNAQNFGLSDLHQLRGRVGRSNKKAFCYLLAPPLISLTQEARRRLTAIEEFSELGSGFNIAMQDLDIRGAGNLLGAEQSGFITDIGFETYHRILNEAIMELKESEFKELYEYENQKEIDKQILNQRFIADCQIETDLEILIPEQYISNISERIRLYRELDNIDTEEKLIDFENQLLDRFGKIPPETIELIHIVRLRKEAIALGFEKIILRYSKLTLHFISDQESPYYKSAVFAKILSYVQHNPKNIQLKEVKNKLTLSFENIQNIEKAIETLKRISM